MLADDGVDVVDGGDVRCGWMCGLDRRGGDTKIWVMANSLRY